MTTGLSHVDAVAVPTSSGLVAHLKGEWNVSLPELVETTGGNPVSFGRLTAPAWAAFHYLEGSVGHDTVTSPADAFEAGARLR